MKPETCDKPVDAVAFNLRPSLYLRIVIITVPDTADDGNIGIFHSSEGFSCIDKDRFVGMISQNGAASCIGNNGGIAVKFKSRD
jgi:hypothetical protein